MTVAKTPRFGPIPRFIAKDCLKKGEIIYTVLQCVVPRGDSRMALVYWVIYRGTGKQAWRWRLYARNGLIIGAASESYARRRGAMENAALMGCPAYRAPASRGVWTTGQDMAWEWEPVEIRWIGAK